MTELQAVAISRRRGVATELRTGHTVTAKRNGWDIKRPAFLHHHVTQVQVFLKTAACCTNVSSLYQLKKACTPATSHAQATAAKNSMAVWQAKIQTFGPDSSGLAPRFILAQ